MPEYKELKVDKLIPYAMNSRTHSDEQVLQVASSIKEFGFTQPILVDEGYGVIAGHCRLMAAKKLEMDLVPCCIIKGLTDAQKKAYVIADNKLAMNADWDLDLLHAEMASINEMDIDIDLSGFSVDEYKDILDEQEEREAKEEKEKPEVEFTEELMESHNYIVLYFDNDVDWLNAQSLFELKTVKALDSKRGFEKQGVGRVVRGVEAIERIKNASTDTIV